MIIDLHLMRRFLVPYCSLHIPFTRNLWYTSAWKTSSALSVPLFLHDLALSCCCSCCCCFCLQLKAGSSICYGQKCASERLSLSLGSVPQKCFSTKTVAVSAGFQRQMDHLEHFTVYLCINNYQVPAEFSGPGLLSLLHFQGEQSD